MLSVRPASETEVRAVQSQVLRPDGPLPGDIPRTGHWLHVAAVVEDRVVGACSVGPAPWQHPEMIELAPPHWQLRSMAVLPEFRGGTGTRVLAAAVDVARAAGAGGLWADARCEAVSLYTRGGWALVGPQWVKAGIGPHRHVVLRFPVGVPAGRNQSH